MAIQLVDHSNPNGKQYSGTCCDCCLVLVLNFCTDNEACDSYFELSVASTVSSSASAWKNWRTKILAGNNRSFEFPGYGEIIGANGLANPLSYHFNTAWPVSFQSSVMC